MVQRRNSCDLAAAEATLQPRRILSPRECNPSGDDLAAWELVARIIAGHSPVLFPQSGGCCGEAHLVPYPGGYSAVGNPDILLGEIG
ncbi:DUF779 domain-containing protein [uncultured Bosea sp.]|uniref:DUF779 domain-containing protein n=1 Tax=uncultured Bosea sp. TaxID=211457 RepID=UPI00345CF1C1